MCTMLPDISFFVISSISSIKPGLPIKVVVVDYRFLSLDLCILRLNIKSSIKDVLARIENECK